jgi:hypothetical protein
MVGVDAPVVVSAADSVRFVTVAAAILVLQLIPVPLVQSRALADVLQDGIARPDGVVAVSAPRIVLAVCVASCALVACPERLENEKLPQENA